MKDIPRWLLALAGLAILGLLAWYFMSIIVYMMVAGVLSLIGQPLTDLIEKIKIGKFKMPRAAAALLTMVTMLSILIGLFSIFIPLVTNQAEIISSIDLNEVTENLEEPIASLEAMLEKYRMISGTDEPLTVSIKNRLKEAFSFTNVSNILNNLFGTMGNIFVAVLSIPFILFFFLKEKGLFFRIIKALTPANQSTHMDNVLTNIKRLLTRYFIGILIQISIITIFVSVGLTILGIKNALLIGFMAGLFNIIPYLGPLIGATAGILLGISTNLDITFYPDMVIMMGKIAAVFAAMQLLDNLVLQPVIFSNSVQADPLEIFLVIIAAGTVGGVTGMILAIPAYTVLRVVAKEFFSQYGVVQKLTRNI